MAEAHVVAALKDKRAELSGSIADLEAPLVHLVRCCLGIEFAGVALDGGGDAIDVDEGRDRVGVALAPET